jgi:SAM-dependent methyltransferase
MDVEAAVARHYTGGSLQETLFALLQKRGKDPDNLTIEDLADIDEFHLGWGTATEELAADLPFQRGMTVLEVGSGIGGPARHLATLLGCDIVGLDLTPEFVEVAQVLTKRCHLSGKVSFVQGSALAMPFGDGHFDGAMMLHVGMNIADKPALFREVRRVLKPGACFGVYDIMRAGEGELPYPMPWAMTLQTSFVEPAAHYRAALEGAGFSIDLERNHRDLGLRLGREMREKTARDGAPPAGPMVLMGASAPQRLGNVMAALSEGLIAPIEMVTKAV